MQCLYIRQTKSSKKGINIHDQLFTIHTPSGEHQKSPQVSLSGTVRKARFGGLFEYKPPRRIFCSRRIKQQEREKMILKNAFLEIVLYSYIRNILSLTNK